MYGYIYKTTNLINGKIYVGQKKCSHFCVDYKGSGKRLYSALRKYDEKNFITELIEECENRQQLDERERYWIAKLNARNPNVGYNIAEGGLGSSNSGKKFSEQARKNMSEARKGAGNHRYGTHMSDETKQKISAKKKGKKMSDIARKHISEGHKGKHHKGVHPSEATLQRMRDAHKGMPSPNKGKHFSEETKKKLSISISKALTGVKKSKEHCLHLSLAASKRQQHNYYRYPSKEAFMLAHNGMDYVQYKKFKKENNL